MRVKGSSGKESRAQIDYPSVMHSEQLLAVCCRINFTAAQQVFCLLSEFLELICMSGGLMTATG